MNKRVLITGGFGFLGRNTAFKFKQEGFNVTAIGYGSWKSQEYQKFGIDNWVESGINLQSLKELKHKFDVIVHCAGGSSVGNSILNPYQDFNNTVSITANLLEYIRVCNSKAKLIYPSSAAVYGAKDNSRIKESDKLNPISPYGYHKKIVEELCESYSNNYGLNINIIRFFSIYGEGLQKQLLWDVCQKITNFSGEELEFFGTGEETRDWINIKDATSLIYKTSINNKLIKTFNGASGQKHTVKEIIEILIKELDSDKKIRFNNKIREGDPRYFWADVALAQKLQWKSEIDICEGIKNYIKWYREFGI